MVAETFLPPVEGKEFVNHIDEDKLNSELDNLEWCTRSENIQHSIARVGNRKGTLRSDRRLEMEKVLTILTIYNKYSLKELASRYKVSTAIIHGLIKGTRYKDITRRIICQ